MSSEWHAKTIDTELSLFQRSPRLSSACNRTSVRLSWVQMTPVCHTHLLFPFQICNAQGYLFWLATAFCGKGTPVFTSANVYPKQGVCL